MTTLINDEFGYIATALRHAEAHLVNVRKSDDPNVIVGNHDNLLRSIRLALTLISPSADGLPGDHISCEELAPFLPPKWVVTKAGRLGCQQQTRYRDHVAITPRRLKEAERAAIEARVPQTA